MKNSAPVAIENVSDVEDLGFWAIMHIVLMVSAWGFVAPVTALLSFTRWTRWKLLHPLSGGLTIALTMGGLAAIYVDRANVFNSTHAYFGFFTVIMMLIQASVGVVSISHFRKARYRAPCFSVMHWVIGYYLLLIAATNMVLGLLKTNVQFYPWPMTVLLVNFTFLGVVLIFVWRHWARQRAPAARPLRTTKVTPAKNSIRSRD